MSDVAPGANELLRVEHAGGFWSARLNRPEKRNALSDALVAAIVTPEQRARVNAYIAAAASKSDLERTDLAKDKTGVFTGAFATNPLLPSSDPRARIPIWVADYVLASYGTGAIMAVPVTAVQLSSSTMTSCPPAFTMVQSRSSYPD